MVLLINRRPEQDQRVVLYKEEAELREAEESTVGSQPSCSLQDHRRPGPAAKPQRKSILGPQPSCSLQDTEGGLFDRGGAAGGDSARPPADDPCGIAPDNRDGHLATSSGYPVRLGRREGRSRSCADDSLGGVAADIRAGYKRAVEDGKGQAGKLAGNKGKVGDSSGGSEQNGKPSILSRNTAESEPNEKNHGI